MRKSIVKAFAFAASLTAILTACSPGSSSNSRASNPNTNNDYPSQPIPHAGAVPA